MAEKTQEEKEKAAQEEAQKQLEAKRKIVDGIVKTLRDEFEKNADMVSIQSLMNEVQRQIAGFQVIAAGAQHGPTDEQKEQKLPLVSTGMADGTPVANIAQAKPEPDQEGKSTSKAPSPATPTKK